MVLESRRPVHEGAVERTGCSLHFDLAPDDRVSRLREADAQLLAQAGMDGFQSAVAAPEAEGVLHCLPRRQIMRQEAPAAATADHGGDAVEDLSALPAARASTGPGGWYQRFDDRPFPVG
jgi:hypothetical protein